MSDVQRQGTLREDWCERLEQAVTDGRFLEDPAQWRAHVKQCAACRKIVEGVFLLRDYVGQARMDDDLGDQPPLVGAEIVADAIERHRAERQRLLVFWSMGVSVLLLVGGLFLFTRTSSESPSTARTHAAEDASVSTDDPVAYGLSLSRRLFPPGELPRYELLKEDEALREEFRRALDHPSSYVRRVALWGLASSGVEIDAGRFEQFFRTFDETLDSNVLQASSAGAARSIEGALAAHRTQTLIAALTSAHDQAMQRGVRVAPALLTPFLVHTDAGVRRAALTALQEDPSYRPGLTEERLLARDDDVEVRAGAAGLLIARQGAGGVARVIAHLRTAGDWELEQRLVTALAEHQDGIAFARERTENPATPLGPALVHALVLARKGERAAALRLVPRAVADGDVVEAYRAAQVARELVLDEQREGLQRRWRAQQERWRTANPVTRRDLAELLVPWDEESGGDQRLMWSLEIIADFEKDPGPVLRRTLKRLASSGSQPVRVRAGELLKSLGG